MEVIFLAAVALFGGALRCVGAVFLRAVDVDFFAAELVVFFADVFVAVFFGAAFLLAAFVAVAFFAVDLVGVFLAVVFLAGVFFAVVFFAVVFFAVVFFAVVFFAGVFFAVDLVAVFFAVVFFAGVFFAVVLFAALADRAGAEPPATDADFLDVAVRAGVDPRAAVVMRRSARPIRPPAAMDTFSRKRRRSARTGAANIRIRRVAAPLSTPPPVRATRGGLPGPAEFGGGADPPAATIEAQDNLC